MIEAFVITLREGTEAALVVCLALGYLRKIGRHDFARAIWAGVGLAALLSIAAAVAIKVANFSTEGAIEGTVLLVSCAMVSWLLFWMWRHGKELKQKTESKLGELSGGSRFGIFLFAFLMVLREGAETVLMLVPVDFTSDSVLAAGAAVAGLAVAVALGVAFYKGSFRVDLRKFFAVTTVILLLFAVQLLVSGLHEYAEQGWIPATETSMRIIGPLMKHSALFVIAVLALPFVFMLRRATASQAPAANEAEERKVRAQFRGERIAKASFAVLAIGAIATLGFVHAHESKQLVLSEPEAVYDAAPEISVPVAAVSDGKLHRFGLKAEGKLLRFLVIRTDEKKNEYGTAMDACTICNDWGYVQTGERILCRNCVAEINAPTVGEGGGCNPIPVKHERRGDQIVLKLEAMTAHASFFKTAQRVVVKCAVCGMEVDAAKAGQVKGKWYCDMPDLPCKKALEGRN